MKRTCNDYLIKPSENCNYNNGLHHGGLKNASLAPLETGNAGRNSASSETSRQGRVACVVDMDNVCSRRGKYGRRAWAPLNVLAFAAAIKERGITLGTICQHQPFHACGSKLWSSLGLRTVSTGENADERVKLEAVTYASEAKIDWLVLIASDGGYFDTLSLIRECGIKIELWALREAVSRNLIFLVDRLRWIDELVDEPHPPAHASAHPKHAANQNVAPLFNAIVA
jgi:hypothetical protein